MHRTERVKKGFPKYFLQIHCFQKSTAVNNMIVGANQWTGFYMITASVMKEFSKVRLEFLSFDRKVRFKNWFHINIHLAQVHHRGLIISSGKDFASTM